MLIQLPLRRTPPPQFSDLIAHAALVGLDTETTGLFIERGARIWEFALVDRGGLRLGWSAPDPQNPAMPREVLAQLFDHIEHKVLVGHNLAFDLKMLADEADRAGLYCPSLYCVDTLGLSRALLKGELSSFALDQVAQHLKIPLPPTLHRAEPDAHLALAILKALRTRFNLQTLDDANLRRFAL